MPLKDNLWAWGKCGYKILQYFGAAVPAVASPVGINTEFVKTDKTGMLAESGEDWESALSALIENLELRRNMGKNGYAYLLENHSQRHFAHKYLALMQDLVL